MLTLEKAQSKLCRATYSIFTTFLLSKITANKSLFLKICRMSTVSMLSMECLPIEREDPCISSSRCPFVSRLFNDLVLPHGFLVIPDLSI